MDLSPLIAPLVFIGVARLSALTNLKPLTASCLAVVPPFLFTLVLRAIYINGYSLPFLPNFISITDAVIFILQILIAVIVFRKLDDNEDSLLEWFVCAIGGLVAVIYLIPFVVHSLSPLVM